MPYTFEDFEQWDNDSLDLITIEENYGAEALDSYMSYLYNFVK